VISIGMMLPTSLPLIALFTMVVRDRPNRASLVLLVYGLSPGVDGRRGLRMCAGRGVSGNGRAHGLAAEQSMVVRKRRVRDRRRIPVFLNQICLPLTGAGRPSAS
jgi:hypothetical protein